MKDTSPWSGVRSDYFVIECEPCSVNSLYANSPGHGRFLTSAGKKFKEYVRAAALFFVKTRSQYPIIGNVSVRIDFTFKDNRRDVDNCIKPILDSISGICFANDRQIVEIMATKKIDKNNPNIRIQIS